MKVAFFDFETTGKELKTDRVTQLAVALYDIETKRMLGCYSNTLYSEEYPPVHPGASAVTGMTDDYLKRVGELPREAFMILMSYFGKAEKIIGHNIKKFDLPILFAEMERVLVPIEGISGVVDTRTDLDIPEHIITRKLSYLCIEHGIPVVNAHAAIFDVIMNAELFFKYDIAKTFEWAKSPEIYVRADVKFDDKQLAKDRKYFWDGSKKIWVKQIKEMHYDDEKKNSPFPVLKLDGYEPAET